MHIVLVAVVVEGRGWVVRWLPSRRGSMHVPLLLMLLPSTDDVVHQIHPRESSHSSSSSSSAALRPSSRFKI